MKNFAFAILVLAFTGNAVAASDHPLTGVFYVGGEDAPGSAINEAQDKLNCTLSFTIGQSDGRFVSYLLNDEATSKSGAPVYDEWGAGNCTMNSTRTEDHCISTSGVANASEPAFGNLYSGASKDVVSFRIFSAEVNKVAPLTTLPESQGHQFHATRCAFTEGQIAQFLSGRPTTLTIDTWSALVMPVGTDDLKTKQTLLLNQILAK